MSDEIPIVTGAGGFVGRALVARLGARAVPLSLGGPDWRARIAAAPLAGATVYHLAARVHAPRAAEEDFHHDNAAKSEALAVAASRARARRLVFLSSAKVHGEESGARPFDEAGALAPQDAYARSKAAAERMLAALAARTGLAVVVARAPLVYGRGARGNLRALLRLADTPWPLPFAALHNRRSFIHVEDLAAALVACATAESAAGRTFLVAHRETLSTHALAAGLRERLGRRARLFALPPALLESLAALAGRREAALRLTRSLEVDPAAAEAALGWRATRGVADCLDDLVAGYRREGAP